MASNLGELLLREKILSVEQLKSALEFQKKNSLPVGTSLVQLGYLTEEDIAQALSRQLGYPYIDLEIWRSPSSSLSRAISANWRFRQPSS